MGCPECKSDIGGRDHGWKYGSGRLTKYPCGTVVGTESGLEEVGVVCQSISAGKDAARIAELEAELKSALAVGRRWYDSDRQRMVMVMEANQKRRAAEAKLARVGKAIQSLTNEINGTFEAYEMDLRTVMGNTNYHCIVTRRDELNAILTDTRKPLAVFDAATDEDIVWPSGLGGGDFFEVDFWSAAHAGAGSQKITVIVLPKEGE